MKITICGSIAFYDKMLEIKRELEELKHEVDLPPFEIKDDKGRMIPVLEYYRIRKSETSDDSWVWNEKERAIRNHFDKIVWADVILVVNYDKNNVPGYIGGNTFLEMGIAFFLKKKIFLLNPIPEVSYREEILGMKPIVINNSLNEIYYVDMINRIEIPGNSTVSVYVYIEMSEEAGNELQETELYINRFMFIKA